MRGEHHVLRQVSVLSIRDSGFSQANLLQQLTDYQEKLSQEHNVQLATTMTENFTQIMNMLQVYDTISEQVAPRNNHQVGNATNDSNVTNLQLMEFLENSQNNVDTLERKIISNNNGISSTNICNKPLLYHVDTPSKPVFKLKANSGATCHYLKKEHSSSLKT